MLEGTKHEKVVLVILAYIIGLTSGFIGFGINSYSFNNSHYGKGEAMPMMDDYPFPNDTPVLGTADKAGYVPPTGQPPTDDMLDQAVTYENGQLIVATNEGYMMLSAHIDKLGDTIPETLAIQGHHTVPPTYLSSPDGRYVYFCEQHLGADDCVNLLFDKNTASIQYIQVENQKFNSSIAQAISVYWVTEGLHIGEYTSISATTPWKLVKNNE